MNKYVITVDSLHVYDGYYRTVADAVFGVLRTHALGPHGEHQVPLGKLVSIQALLVARLEPRSTSGCVLRVPPPKSKPDKDRLSVPYSHRRAGRP